MPTIKRVSHIFVISSLMAALGAILALESVAPVFCLGLALSFYLLALALGLGRRRSLALVLAFVVFYCLAQERMHNLLPQQNDLSQVRANYVKFVGTVVACKTQAGQTGQKGSPTAILEVAAARLIEPWSHPLTGRVLVRVQPNVDASAINDAAAVSWGGTYIFRGRLTRPSSKIFSFEFDQRRRLRLKGINCEVTCQADGCQVLSTDKSAFDPCTSTPITMHLFSMLRHIVGQLAVVRQGIIASHCLTLGQERGKLLTSMVLGDRAVDLSDTIKTTFMRVGLSHLLAASGLNLTIIVGAVIFFFRWRKSARQKTEMTPPQTLVALICVLFFVSLAGVSPSVTRATIMCLLLLWSSLVFRKLALGSALAGALYLALMLDPTSILDVGLELSYGATFGIIYFYPLLTSAWPRVSNKLGAWLLALTNVVLSAQIAVLPVQIYCFQKISTLVVPANILAEPLVAPITVMGFLSSFICATAGLILSAIAPLPHSSLSLCLTAICCAFVQTAKLIDLVSGYLIDWLLALARFLAAAPLSYLYLARVPVSSVVFYYLALLLAFVSAFHRPRLAACLALGAASALTLQAFLLSSVVEILLDGNGNRNRIVVAGTQEQPLLITVGPEREVAGGSGTFLPGIKENGYLPGFHRDFVQSYLRSLSKTQPQTLALPAFGTYVCASRAWGGLTVASLASAQRESGDGGDGNLIALTSDWPAAAVEVEEAQGVRLYKYKTWGALWLLIRRLADQKKTPPR